MKRNSRKILLAAILLSCVTGVFADSNERGIDLYRAGLHNAAKIFFVGQTNQSATEQAENYYYLGQIYYDLQQKDSASYYYDKSVATDPNYPFGYIGQGKILLEGGNKKEAENLFKKANDFAKKIAKKDASAQTTIAEVYIAARLYPEAEEALDKARKINKNYPGIYVAEGDMLAQENKIGEACARYENATTFDRNYKVAYLKLARVYKTINQAQASNYLNQLVEIDPNYIPAYAEIGDLYDLSSVDEMNVNYTKALNAYEKFISIPGVPQLYHERHARLLYFTEQYEQSLQEIGLLLKQKANPVLYRLQAYNNFKLENYALSAEQLKNFLQTTPEADHIYLDYLTLARSLVKEKEYEQAITCFTKASELKNIKPEVYKQIYKETASAYLAIDNYPEAIKMYEKFLATEESPSAVDYFALGEYSYTAAVKYVSPEYLNNKQKTPEEQAMDSVQLNFYIEKGNYAFTEVIRLRPESFLGYLYRARIHSVLDAVEQARTEKVKGIALPYYEEAIGIMLTKNEDGARNNDLLEAYRYLGSYYYVQKDKAKAGEYYKKILEIDPANAGAKAVLDDLKIKY
ncbi:MAG: tetratricopeptide repeat protein [Dysgonamonadaceae bacterium]|jgi:tetratricopeptide (TPR) repeat protein|nr:tetratricopeptide repeat protein [Dysgonamonadaceae bacterium]